MVLEVVLVVLEVVLQLLLLQLRVLVRKVQQGLGRFRKAWEGSARFGIGWGLVGDCLGAHDPGGPVAFQ